MSGGDGLTTWTLGAIKGAQPCARGLLPDRRLWRFYVFDVDNLIATAGADYVVPDILPGVACTECGGALKFKLAMVPPDD